MTNRPLAVCRHLTPKQVTFHFATRTGGILKCWHWAIREMDLGFWLAKAGAALRS
jgi:hypothetical protein